MAKVSPVSIKYMIRAKFVAEGALEKPDVIGALFGQTEGLLGSELEMRELQKEGKIGRIEVDLERSDKKTTGMIMIPTALDQSETTLIAAAIETIERMGPSDAQIEIEKIEDVRGTKRDYIIERAKDLMKKIEGSTDSREISHTVKTSAKMALIQQYGDEKLPCGDLTDNEVIVVEGRADVLNLLRNGVNNVIAMNGTKLPESIKELSKKKEITLFVDGDRGGKLIVKNVLDNAKIKNVAIAPDGKEVEELTGKEILIALRKKIPASDFLFFENRNAEREERTNRYEHNKYEERESDSRDEKNNNEDINLTDDVKDKIKEIAKTNKGTGKTLFLDENLRIVKEISTKALASTLRRVRKNEKLIILVIDGTATMYMINAAEDAGCQVISASNFSAVSNKIKMLSM